MINHKIKERDYKKGYDYWVSHIQAKTKRQYYDIRYRQTLFNLFRFLSSYYTIAVQAKVSKMSLIYQLLLIALHWQLVFE
jgi:hypothetical protein